MFIKLPLGIPSWIYGDMPLESLLQRAASFGLSWVELTLEPDADMFNIPVLLEAYDVKVASIMAPDVDLAHANKTEREKALHMYEHIIRHAKELEAPLVICRSKMGRTDYDEGAWARLANSLSHLAKQAPEQRLAFDILNRYESGLVNTVDEGLALLEAVNVPNLGLSMGAFHMNIEEQDGAGALVKAGKQLWHYRIADSNRGPIGTGHLKLGAHIWALQDELAYEGVVILEPVVRSRNLTTAQIRAQVDQAIENSQSWF